MKLFVKRFGGHWEILGFESGPVGPYHSKGEAEDDRRGLSRFLRMEAKGELWMTTESERN